MADRRVCNHALQAAGFTGLVFSRGNWKVTAVCLAVEFPLGWCEAFLLLYARSPTLCAFRIVAEEGCRCARVAAPHRHLHDAMTLRCLRAC